MEHETKSIPFELKAVKADGNGSFEGIGGAFHNIDAVGDIIAKGAFERDLPDFLSDGFIGGINHDWDCPIGHPADAKEVPEGLYLSAVFDGTPEGQSARAKMTVNPTTGRATVKRLSIGYKVMPDGFRHLKSEEECRDYWKEAGYTPSAQDIERSKKGARLLTRIKTFEVSPVLVPANDRAKVTATKSEVDPESNQPTLKFDQQAETVVSTITAFVARAKGRHQARIKAGRVLSESNRTRLRTLHERMKEAMDDIAELLASTEPKPDDEAGFDITQNVTKSDPNPDVTVPETSSAETQDLPVVPAEKADEADIYRRVTDLNQIIASALGYLPEG